MSKRLVDASVQSDVEKWSWDLQEDKEQKSFWDKQGHEAVLPFIPGPFPPTSDHSEAPRSRSDENSILFNKIFQDEDTSYDADVECPRSTAHGRKKRPNIFSASPFPDNNLALCPQPTSLTLEDIEKLVNMPVLDVVGDEYANKIAGSNKFLLRTSEPACHRSHSSVGLLPTGGAACRPPCTLTTNPQCIDLSGPSPGRRQPSTPERPSSIKTKISPDVDRLTAQSKSTGTFRPEEDMKPSGRVTAMLRGNKNEQVSCLHPKDFQSNMCFKKDGEELNSSTTDTSEETSEDELNVVSV